ncbi:MAG: MAPEG family protein [Gammaproteobacteria bacterium]|nr:MAPEG family protein [Gammaproteobacteria bacterium]MDE2346119.1 MAPEG family protein [Gammaproteobacteria bacterium]
MDPKTIFAPMLALVAWTFIIMLYMAYKRWSAGFAGRLKPGEFKLGESADVPHDVRLAGRNFSNLFEVPVLFYVLCLTLYVTRSVSIDLLVMAWVYVALRVLHSLIHVSYNKIIHRFFVYAASCFLLLAMWILFAMWLYLRT